MEGGEKEKAKKKRRSTGESEGLAHQQPMYCHYLPGAYPTVPRTTVFHVLRIDGRRRALCASRGHASPVSRRRHLLPTLFLPFLSPTISPSRITALFCVTDPPPPPPWKPTDECCTQARWTATGSASPVSTPRCSPRSRRAPHALQHLQAPMNFGTRYQRGLGRRPTATPTLDPGRGTRVAVPRHGTGTL